MLHIIMLSVHTPKNNGYQTTLGTNILAEKCLFGVRNASHKESRGFEIQLHCQAITDNH